MDKNLNPIIIVEDEEKKGDSKKGYFQEYIETTYQVDPWNMDMLYNDMTERLSHSEDEIDPEALLRLRSVYLNEPLWEKPSKKVKNQDPAEAEAAEMFRRLEDPAVFWKSVIELFKVGGHLVKELKIDLVFNDPDYRWDWRSVELKIDFFLGIPEWCSGLEALEVGSEVVSFVSGDMEDRLLDALEGLVSMNLVHLKLPFTEVHEHWLDYGQKAFFGSYMNESLHYLEVYVDQLEKTGAFYEFPNVTTLKLGNFGKESTQFESFKIYLAEAFPRMKSLRLFMIQNGTVSGLGKLVNYLIADIDLEEFGLDQSFMTIDNSDDIFIKKLDRLVIDVKVAATPSLALLDVVYSCREVIIENMGLEYINDRYLKPGASLKHLTEEDVKKDVVESVFDCEQITFKYAFKTDVKIMYL